ncbi:ABC transporter permease [Conexibacter stalactiti]|uniref:ABC transporter permease n=1 Tax=Conexibacter stalactiti TaxID=1940611 RepID=A0ABU4HJE9_9ACTN|nr:ABC transporter permease [Conexibacter stalactiti]MDW5593443.1 ABC transporter permease [Conexibacter stalactiti]MEC5034084.1 ABC transporter permease [Conexibacter stalactiti]
MDARRNPGLLVPALADGGAAAAPSRWRVSSAVTLQRGVIGAGLALLLFFALTTDGFFTVANAKAIATAASLVGLVAIGQTLIMLGGSGMSLSLGMTSAVSAMAFVGLLGEGVVIALLGALVLAAVTTGIQGFVVGRWAANAVIVTIAAGLLLEGFGSWAAGHGDLTPTVDRDVYAFLGRPLLGIPFPVYAFAVAALVVQWMLRRTRDGRTLLLVGSSREAARAAALPLTRTAVFAFSIAGVCAALTGIMVAATQHHASLSIQGNYTFDSIAATLVGGTLISGGRGSVTRTLIGALVIAAVTDIALLRGYSSGVQTLVKGLLVLVAVILVRLTARR